MHLGALGAEVRRLALQVVESDVELGLVEVLLERVIGRVGTDEPIGSAVERIRLLVDLLGDLVTGVLASVGDSLVELDQCGLDLGLAVGVVELDDGVADLLAILAGLVGLGGGPRATVTAASTTAARRPPASQPRSDEALDLQAGRVGVVCETDIGDSLWGWWLEQRSCAPTGPPTSGGVPERRP